MIVPANLLRVARALEPLREQKFVFAGASILPLLIDDPAAPPPRPTLDVDAVVDVASYARWQWLQGRLADCGLRVRADPGAGHARHCLFHLDDLEVDIMPVRVKALGCPSRMLDLGLAFAEPREVAADLIIFIVAAPGMVAAKLEAFQERGYREFPASDDLGDIVALLDGRVRIEAEIASTDAETRYFIAAQTQRLLLDGSVLDVISDLMRDPVRKRRLLDLMHRIATP